VIVYAGVDPVTGKDVRLTESTRDPSKVEEIRTRLLARVDLQRTAATMATLGYTLDEWLIVHEAKESTLDNYRLLIDAIIRPAVGEIPISKLGARTLEKLYAELRRCRARCDGRPFTEHRTDDAHECRVVVHRRKPGRPSAKAIAEHDCERAGCAVIECQPHICRPLSPSTVRQLHYIISAALEAAHRWDWIPSNPAATAKKPRQTPPQPKPPSPHEAAGIVASALKDDADWGTFIWLKMVTGARRGELLALRWSDVYLDEGLLEIRRNFTRRNGKAREADTKTHQIRRLSLDSETVGLLRAHLDRVTTKSSYLGLPVSPAAYVFSYDPDHSRPCNPDGVSHRYARMCARLGIESHLHTLRHYAATELLSAGVDLRTVAGRLGHGGGGTTTLRVYAAWVPESDRKAAEILARGIKSPRTSA
jgi:integrase